MSDPNCIDSISFSVADARHVVADRDFDDYTRPYSSTLFGTIHLYADGEEITHTNKLPGEFDLVDTVRAQYELVETIERDGEYRAVPFCCVCSDRDCSFVRWEITELGNGYLRLRMEDLTGRSIDGSPYEISRTSLYEGVLDLCRAVIGFCEAERIERFGWADRMEPPIAGRQSYATVSELKVWREDVRELIRSRSPENG